MNWLGRVAVVQAVHVRQQHAGIRESQVAYQSGQAVVVAEAHFRGSNRIVLVDNRHGLQLTQAVDGALGVACAVALCGVRSSKKNLADSTTVTGEATRPLLGQQHLADRRGGLLGSQVGGALGKLQRTHAAGHSTGRNDDEVGVARHARLQRVGDHVNLVRIHTAVVVGQGGRSDLHHQAAGVGDVLTYIGIVPHRRIVFVRLRFGKLNGRRGHHWTRLVHWPLPVGRHGRG